jgi:hypothetical protein
VKLKRGQYVTGRFALAEEMNKGMKPKQKLNDKTWWRHLECLERWGMLTIKSTNKYSVVTVDKYEFYQDVFNKTDQQMTNSCPTNVQQMSTNNNVNNGNNEKKKKYAEFVSLTLEEYEKLKTQFGEQGTADRIERLNLYKGSTGKKYKSDYLTILNWEKKNTKSKQKEIDWEEL